MCVRFAAVCQVLFIVFCVFCDLSRYMFALMYHMSWMCQCLAYYYRCLYFFSVLRCVLIFMAKGPERTGDEFREHTRELWRKRQAKKCAKDTGETMEEE